MRLAERMRGLGRGMSSGVAGLGQAGTVLFAVGAGHLAGPDPVQSMLGARGFSARRVD